MSHSPDLQLLVPARAENVAVVRHAFGGLADALDLPDQVAADIKLAVTEACTNVVLHAYTEDDGPLEVDATIGEESNIGASSVFVNFDGVDKHHTTVGSHVRTGSDTMFIAPVSVGDGAYSGAGTVIKDDVPAGALVVSGGKQRNIEGWVARKRGPSDGETP